MADIELFNHPLYKDPSLVSYWRMEGNSTDTKGVNNGTDTAMSYGTSYGVFGQGASFNGSGSWIDLGNPTSLKITGSQTISMWLKPTALDARRNPFAKSYGGEGTITLETNGTLSYYYGTNGNDGGAYQGFSSNVSISAGQWSYVTLVRDLSGMFLKWYINSRCVNQVVANYSAAAVSTQNAYIGKGYVSPFYGYIDDVAIFNRALTQQEIHSLFKTDSLKYLKKYRRSRLTNQITSFNGANATGGEISMSGNYMIHTFKSSGTFMTPGEGKFDVLVVAGGGGGGFDMGGGGGGGGVIYQQNYSVPANTPINVIVGAGGTGAPGANINGQPAGHQYTISATNGGNSSFYDLIAIGGGYGGSSYFGYTPNNGYGASGGSGGGASGYSDGNTGRNGSGTTGQGYAGGTCSGQYYSGGGGGAGGVGTSGPNIPHGGVGFQCDINGTSLYWGGGGGGAAYSLSIGGNGGNGGGGGGAGSYSSGGAGLNYGCGGGGGAPNSWANRPGGDGGANTGGGGGGGSHYNNNNSGGNGGSGIVIIRYLVNSFI